MESLHQLRRDYEASSSEIKDVIKTYDDHLIAPKGYKELRDQVAKLQADLSSLTDLKLQFSNLQSEVSTQANRMSVLEGKVSAAILMCKQ